MAQGPDNPERPRPWLVAAWPGMGNVAVIAAGYLADQLDVEQIAGFPAEPYFDVTEIEVKEGVLQPIEMPTAAFFRWKNPGKGRDLILFISNAQPTNNSIRYARDLLDVAQKYDIERVVTFASLAAGIHPTDLPKVFGVATTKQTLDELRAVEVPPVDIGQIGGMNGLILAVAAQRGLDGLCLLAEIPFFAIRLPNPKASRAALSVFTILSTVDISLDTLDKQSVVVDKALIEAMDRAERMHDDDDDEPFTASEPDAVPPPKPSPPPTPSLSDADRERIEKLFERAKDDMSQAIRLKSELDRLGVFKQYEGRFLDLFRKAG